MADVKNQRWSVDELLEVREHEVKTQWPTDLGPLEPYFERHHALAETQRTDVVMRAAKAEGRIIVQPRHGDTLVDHQINAMRDLHAAGAEIVSTLTDPYTRQLYFEKAEHALAESQEKGRSLVSGYPVVSYGVANTRRIVEEVQAPCSVRMASSDARLTKEIYLASGYTAMFMGAVQNLAYEKLATPELLVRNYQYEDRLIGLYEENGCPIVKEFPSTLTGTLVPPCIAIAASIIDTLLAIEQGVRRVVCSYGLLGNYLQDLAAVRALRAVSQSYVESVADDIEMYIVSPQWMGDFPQHIDEAYAVIVENALIAALGGTNMVISKSLDEGYGVPSHPANVAGVVASREAVDLVAHQQAIDSPELLAEIDRISRSVRAIIDTTYRLGNGDLAVGVGAAIRAGVIDVPFSPNQNNADLMLPARDLSGAVRFLAAGNIPLPEDVVAYDTARMEERAKASGGAASYQFVVDDIFEFSRGLSPRPSAALASA